MNAKSIRMLLSVLALSLCASPVRPQASLTRADGRITDAGKSLPGVQVVLSHQDTFQVYRATTDKYGTFSIPDVVRGTYIVSILNATGGKLFRKTLELTSEPDAPIRIDIDISGTPATPAKPASNAAPSQPSQAQNAQPSANNALISKYNAALAANDNQAAITALKAIVAADPTRWDFFEALGDMQYNAADYENAAASFEKGIQAARQFLSTPPSTESKLMNSDRDRAKSGIAQMLLNQGNAYLKLKKNDEAIVSYTKAAEVAPDPATAYFNLCVIHYNAGQIDGALDACDKAIAANPNRPDAYFIKGSLLLAASKTDKDGKVTAPPGTADALKKYLQLAPQGPYAAQVKQMLAYIGVKPDSPAASGRNP